MSIKNELIEEFNDEVKGLRGLQLGSDEYKTTVDGVTRLADRIIEIEKIEKDAKSKEIERESNDYLKMKQMEDDKKDRWIRNSIEFVKVGGGLLAACGAFVLSMKFEEDGKLFSTEGGRSALRQLLKFK